MDIVTIDFETYYDREYSLSRMTTEAYIRDKRFEIIGVGVKVNNNPADWYSGENPGKFLNSLDYSKRAILCHNTAFDGAILSWHLGIKPRLWLDTLSMARPWHTITVGNSLKKLASYYQLGEKGDEIMRTMGKRRADFSDADMAAFADYCLTDIDLTYKLFNKLKGKFNTNELILIDQTLRMYTEPVIELDSGLLANHHSDVIHRKASLVEDLGWLGDTDAEIKSHLMSNPKLAAVLEALGVDPPRKISKTTGQATFALGKTDKAFTDLLEHDDPKVVTVVAARLGVKSTLEETRTAALMGVAQRGLLPILLNYYGAHTGRFSGGDKMNLQNLPRGGTLRRALKAPKGKVLVACDSSQIEARIVAWLAGEHELLAAFRSGEDVYCKFASEVYDRPITKDNPLERHLGKTAVLGLGYGMGHIKFRATLALGAGGKKVEISAEEAARIVLVYRRQYHRISRLWTRCNAILTQMSMGQTGTIAQCVEYDGETIILPNGMRLNYPKLEAGGSGGFRYISTNRAWTTALKCRVLGENPPDSIWTHVYGGRVVENIVQALARIVVCDQMVRIGQRYKVVLQVHDEVVCLVDEAEAEEAKAFVESVMRTPPQWAPDLPVNCECKIGKTYGECK